MTIRLPAALLLATLCSVPGPTRAAESYDGCTGFIDSVPATISSQGTWCLRSDLSTGVSSGSAITVAANNVTLDCNGFKLGGLLAGTGTQAYGVLSDARLNLTIRRCNIRGFAAGVLIGGAPSAGHLVEDNRFDGNTRLALQINGAGSIVRRNLMLDTGGSTIYPGEAYAMYVFGNVDLLDNTITGVTAVPDGGGGVTSTGIILSSSGSSRVNGNVIRDLVRAGDGTATGITILPSSNRTEVSGNYITGPGNRGIVCGNASTAAYDNHINGFTLGVDVCQALPNVVVP